MNPDRPKILIVDDLPQNLFVMNQLLKKQNIDVVQCTTGAEALGLALENDFCLAIVDVQMPEMDGYELVELLRGNESTATLPVIFVSAIFSDEYHHRKGYDAGAVDFISKPFPPEILLSKVKIFLELYQQRHQLEEFNAQLEEQVRQRTQELQQAYSVLQKLDKIKTDFINLAAHELRTPLTLIHGYGSMLEPLVENDQEATRLLRGILAGEGRLTEVVNSLLTVSRIDSNAIKISLEQVDVTMVIKHIVNSYEQILQERSLTIALDELPDLPSIPGDTHLLQNMLNQLVSNAIKYTPDGGKITIAANVIPEGQSERIARDAVQITITDTGIGIDPEYHQLIFDRFFHAGPVQLHSSGKTKFKGGGPGLGLSIARGIAEIHGGAIWVESDGYDETALPGSSFHIILPLYDA